MASTETDQETAQERLQRQMEEQKARMAWQGSEGPEEGQDGAIPGQLDTDGGEVQPPAESAASMTDLKWQGPRQLGVYSTGGKEPTRATLVLGATKIALEAGTTFKKGDVIQFSGTAVVVGAADTDKLDKQTGMVVECNRQLTAKVNDAWQVTD